MTERESFFWRKRKGRVRRNTQPIIKGSRKVTRSPRNKDPFFRLPSRKLAMFSRSMWKGLRGTHPKSKPVDNCYISAEFAEYLMSL